MLPFESVAISSGFGQDASRVNAGTGSGACAPVAVTLSGTRRKSASATTLTSKMRRRVRCTMTVSVLRLKHVGASPDSLVREAPCAPIARRGTRLVYEQADRMSVRFVPSASVSTALVRAESALRSACVADDISKVHQRLPLADPIPV